MLSKHVVQGSSLKCNNLKDTTEQEINTEQLQHYSVYYDLMLIFNIK